MTLPTQASDKTLSRQEGRELLLRQKKPKNKYGARRVTVDGVSFHSKAEATYYANLKIREKANEVGGVERQKHFTLLAPNGYVVGVYVADFAFWDHKEDRFRVIDVKGMDTKLSYWKRRHVKAQYGIDVELAK